jgi:hypothetical protein
MADSAGYHVLANLPGEGEALTEAQYAADIRALAESDAVGWWDFPEERRYWVPAEMQLVENLAAWTRQHDPARRPRYMYIPGHYRASDIAHYVPYLDVVPASVYPAFNDQPHAWTRWRIEETVTAIAEAGATIGADYLAGEKTVVAVLELFDSGTGRAPSPEGTYHDFWLSVACGARGVLVSSYAYHAGSPALAATWARLQEAAAQLSGAEGVGSAFLFGDEVHGIAARILSGAPRTESFVPTPHGSTAIDLPSVKVAARRHQDDLYLIVVNSAESAISARITGLPAHLDQAAYPFEDRTAPISEGRLDLSLDRLGVRILVVRSAFQGWPDAPTDADVLSVEPPRPNPTRLARRTTITIAVPTEGRIEASVYDVVGRRVAVLFEGTLTAGRHHLNLDLTGLAKGSYLLRIDGLGSTVSRQLTLVD